MADLLSGGEAINVAVTGQRANEAGMESSPVVEGVKGVRSLPGLLGIPGVIAPNGILPLRSVALVPRSDSPFGYDYVYGPLVEIRLAEQVWYYGD